MTDLKNSVSHGAMNKADEPTAQEREMLEAMQELRSAILAQIDNRIDKGAIGLDMDQKALMRIELYLGAGFALGCQENPLGAVFLNEASAMSAHFAEQMQMRQSGVAPEGGPHWVTS